MQPNQQNHNQNFAKDYPQSGSTEHASQQLQSSGSSNVPDFLHLDPITDAPGKSSTLKRNIYIILAFLILTLIAGAVYYWFFVFNSAEERFLRAIENNLQIGSVSRYYEIEKPGRKSTITAFTDFSGEGYPKTDMLAKNIVRLPGNVESSSTIQAVVTNDENYVFSVKDASQNAVPADIILDRWYRTEFHTAGRKDIGYQVSDIPSPLLISSAQGIVPLGGFADSERREILNYIRQNQIYTVDSVIKKTENKQSLTGYEVYYDNTKINDLNKKLTEVRSGGHSFSIQKPYPQYQKTVFWYEDATGKFVKMSYSSGKSEKDVDTNASITFTYPENRSVAMPDNITELSD